MSRIVPEAVSVVIPCKNEKENIKKTISAIKASKYGTQVEIIVVDDGSTDGCCEGLERLFPKLKVLTTSGKGVSYARNLGARAAQGDILLFCDANILPAANWLEKLLEAFKNPQIKVQAPGLSNAEKPNTGGYGMTLNERLEGVWLPKRRKISPVPILPSTCLAIDKEVYFQVGGFDEGFRVLGHEDVELSIRLWLLGYPLYINPYTRVYHIFRTEKPYKVGQEHWIYNIIRMGCLHFNAQRIEKTLALFQEYEHFTRLVAETMVSDVWIRREMLLKSRKFDDDWFVANFTINF